MNPLPKNTSAELVAVFLDANILLEVLLARPQETTARRALLGLKMRPCISALTAHLVVHFGRSVVTLPVLRKFLSDYTVLPLEASDFEWAFMNARNADFEDALQLAVAVRHGCGRFITLDKTLHSVYKELPTLQVELPWVST